jgi:hypothetical protein
MILQNGSTIQDIRAKVVMLDYQGKPVTADHYPKGLMIIFPSISGQIDGSYGSKPMQSIPAAIGSEFTLDLNDLAGRIREVSTTMANNVQTQGLLVEPPSTKFARVATVAVDPANGKVVGGASFMDPASQNIMVLVYTDRSCAITGTSRIEGRAFKHEVRFDRPGFHWIRYHRLGKGNFLLKDHTASGGVQFLIRQTERNQI